MRLNNVVGSTPTQQVTWWFCCQTNHVRVPWLSGISSFVHLADIYIDFYSYIPSLSPECCRHEAKLANSWGVPRVWHTFRFGGPLNAKQNNYYFLSFMYVQEERVHTSKKINVIFQQSARGLSRVWDVTGTCHVPQPVNAALTSPTGQWWWCNTGNHYILG